MRFVVKVLLGALAISALHAQLDLLTLSEAERIVEKIPAVVDAQQKGECPDLSASYQGEHLWFGVRSSCGPSAGMLINRYDLNRRTGEVSLWGDDPQPVADAAGKELTSRLVRHAQRRILSANEAKCLVVEAAQALPGWNERGSTVLVKPFGSLENQQVHFTAQHSSRARPTTSGRMLTVNLSTAEVRDDQVGLDVMSEKVGSLTAKMLELRKPLSLSDEDALTIVLTVPSVASRLRAGCKLSTGGTFRSNEALVGFLCDGPNSGSGSVAVNLETGVVTDVDTGKVLESPEGARLARQLIDGIQHRRSELQAEISAACRQQ